MMQNISLYTLLISSILFCSCHKSERDNVETAELNSDTISDPSYVYVHDTIYSVVHDTIIKNQIVEKKVVVKEKVYTVIPEAPLLDSLQTAIEYDNVVAYGYMLCQPDKNGLMPGLYGSYGKDDMKHFPYLFHMFTNKKVLPEGNYDYLQELTSCCTSTLRDDRLFSVGREIVDNTRNTPLGNYAFNTYYPQKFNTASDYVCERFKMNGNDINIDSLRVRAIVYNDRNALTRLEQYHRQKNDPKGIAIFYKIMLGYDGNGDLAEKFYDALEPYFEKTPQFRSAVREVLLRAALCDHNERAQQLCDSLGFSLCDYRTPPPSQD